MIIRRVPEDFLVEETLAGTVMADMRPAFSSDRPVAVFRLSKVSLTTPEACRRLEKALGVRGVEHAGLKDKHARTVQHVSVRWNKPTPPQSQGLSGPGWSAELAGFVRQPLFADAIERNRFEVVVRGLTRNACELAYRRARWLTVGEAEDSRAPLLFVNYFGEQRFGSARHGEGFAGRSLIKGDFEGTLKLLIGSPARKDSGAFRRLTRAMAQHWGNWRVALDAMNSDNDGEGPAKCPERRALEVLAEKPGAFREAFAALPSITQTMCVEAYQSWLWNETAREMVLQSGVSDTASVATDFGEQVLLPANAIPKSWLRLEVPMLGEGSAVQGPWASAARAVLEREGVTTADLVVPGLRRPAFREAPRSIVAVAETFSIEDGAAPVPGVTDKKLAQTVRFDLPRGAYATVVLRAVYEAKRSEATRRDV